MCWSRCFVPVAALVSRREQMGGMMKSWADERERLVQQLEQTQAYCSSLAFQVS